MSFLIEKNLVLALKIKKYKAIIDKNNFETLRDVSLIISIVYFFCFLFFNRILERSIGGFIMGVLLLGVHLDLPMILFIQ